MGENVLLTPARQTLFYLFQKLETQLYHSQTQSKRALPRNYYFSILPFFSLYRRNTPIPPPVRAERTIIEFAKSVVEKNQNIPFELRT